MCCAVPFSANGQISPHGAGSRQHLTLQPYATYRCIGLAASMLWQRIGDSCVVCITQTSGIDSSGNRVGDTFRGTLNAPIRDGGDVVIPAGADVQGRVLDVPTPAGLPAIPSSSWSLRSSSARGKRTRFRRKATVAPTAVAARAPLRQWGVERPSARSLAHRRWRQSGRHRLTRRRGRRRLGPRGRQAAIRRLSARDRPQLHAAAASDGRRVQPDHKQFPDPFAGE
jgi:hypothetical protein